MEEAAVVSGAGSGIGRAVAERLARSGYRVALLGRRVDALEQTVARLAGDGHAVCAGDLTDPSIVKDVSKRIEDEFNQVAALVHCAGGGRPRQGDGLPDLRTSMVEAFEANVVSTAMLTAAALGPRRITVNLVAPGYVTDTEFFGDAMTQERHDRLVGETMVGRPATPNDVASTIEHLVSGDARHVTAQVVQVNGGALPR